MKLHDLKPAEGSRRPRKRVGRGIAAGQGKTAGRGTKGQKARAGGSIPPWFEGGQTPLHMRIPKLRGFKNRFKVDYEIVNVGRIGELALLGAFGSGEGPGGKAAPLTVNQDILRATGLVRTLSKPLKVLGHGDIEVALFIVADAFSKSAVAKIEAAGGSVQVLEVPSAPLAALGLEPTSDEAPSPKAKAKAKAAAASETTDEPTSDEEPAPKGKAKSKAEAAPAKAKAKSKVAAEPPAPADAGPTTPVEAVVAEVVVAEAAAEPAEDEPTAAPADDAPTDEDA
jgi:large subunit ribosomal protein L15